MHGDASKLLRALRAFVVSFGREVWGGSVASVASVALW
jgi:hypothetical protein